MLKILLVNDGEGRTRLLRDALGEAGVRVIGEIEACADLARVLDALRPDMVLIDTDAPSRDTLEAVCVASEHGGRPVVMFTDDGRRDSLRAAIRAGVSAYVVGTVDGARVENVLAVAAERFEMERTLKDELAETRTRLAERQWVDKAKGLLMRLKQLDEDEAFRLLRTQAMREQKRIGEVAQAMVEAAGWLA